MSALNRSISSITLLASGLIASLGSTCGDIPLPIAENGGPQFRINAESPLYEFDVTVDVDPTILPLGEPRYSHILFDLVPSADSYGSFWFTLEDQWGQTLLREAVFIDGSRPVQMVLDDAFNDCSEHHICSQNIFVDFDRISGEVHLAWYVVGEMEAGEVWAEDFAFDIREIQ